MLQLLKRTKGKTLNKVGKSMISVYMKKKNIGDLKDFGINMETKMLTVSFVPTYFSEEVRVEVARYNIIQDKLNNKNYLSFDSINTSKNWNDSKFKKLIKKNKIEIPEKYSKFIDLVA